MNEAINISIYKTAEDNLGLIAPFLSILGGIKSGKWKESIEGLRRLGKEEYDIHKKYLPGVTFGGSFTRRSKDPACVVTYTGIVVLDFDKIEDVDNEKNRIVSDPIIISAFISPSKSGMKVLVQTNASVSHHSDAWQRLYWYFLKKYGLKADPSGKDVSRLCFVSWDPDLYYNPSARVFEVSRSKKIPITDEVKIFEICKKWTEKHFSYSEGTRNNFVHLLACNLNDCGIILNNALSFIFDEIGAVDDKLQKEYIKTIESAYKKTGKGIVLYEKQKEEVFSENIAEDEIIRDAIALLEKDVSPSLIYPLMELKRDSLIYPEMTLEEMGMANGWLRTTLNKAHKILVNRKREKVGSGRMKTIEDMMASIINIESGQAVSSCIEEFDNILEGGFICGNLYGLIGREGTGKSIYSLLVGCKAAEVGHGVVMWNGEMSVPQILNRVIKHEVGIYFKKEIKEGMVNEKRVAEMTRQVNQKLKNNLFVVSQADFSAEDIIDHIKSVKDVKGKQIKLVIIDGLSHMADVRNDEIRSAIENSKLLKEVAKQCNVAILVLVHIKTGIDHHFRNAHDKRLGGNKLTANMDGFVSTSLCVDESASNFGQGDIKYKENLFYLRLVDKRESGKTFDKIITTRDPLVIEVSSLRAESFEVAITER